MQLNIGTPVSVFVFLLFLGGCDVNNPDETIPSYIQIDKIDLSHEKAIGITDAWVYINGEHIGVFELPAKFPVLAEGETDIMISAGIKVNGISNTRTYYPFYNSYRSNRNLTPKETLIINPTLGYDSEYAKITWQEGFENTQSFTADEDSETTIIIDNAKPFDGESCGSIYLDTANNYFLAYSNEVELADVNSNRGIYLEMNFKTNNYVVVGYKINHIQTVFTEDLVILNHTNEWKKLYIDMYSTIAGYSEGDVFQVYIEALLEDDNENALIYIDDMKIVQ